MKKRLLIGFYILLAVLLIMDLFIHKHGEFQIEEIPAFYAVCGFIACVLLVLGSKVIAIILNRDENYYE